MSIHKQMENNLLSDINVLFGDSPRLAWFFSSSLLLVFVLLSGGAAILLFIPSYLLGIASVRGGAVDQGFMHTSWPYTTGMLMPVIITLMVAASRGTCRTLA